MKIGMFDRVYSINKIAAVVTTLCERGILVHQLLDGTGLVEGDLTSAAVRVSRDQTLTVLANATELAPDADCAYRAGERLHISSLGIYGFTMLSCPDFRRVCHYAVQYHEMSNPLIDLAFSEAHGQGIWTITPLVQAQTNAKLLQFIIEMHLAGILQLHQELIGADFSPSTIDVSFAPPPTQTVYQLFEHCTVRFAQPQNQIVFDAAWLDRPATLSSAATYETLSEMSTDIADKLIAEAGMSGKVRTALLSGMSGGFNQDRVCERLGVTARTLRRMLADEGTSFREIFDDLRTQVAIKYLRDTKLTVESIAFSVGYHDTANFRRAFRKHTGKTPQQMREDFTDAQD